MMFVRVKRWNKLVKSAKTHDPSLTLTKIDGYGSYVPDTVQDQAVRILNGDTSEDDLYFYLFTVISPSSPWCRILHKVKADGAVSTEQLQGCRGVGVPRGHQADGRVAEPFSGRRRMSLFLTAAAW